MPYIKQEHRKELESSLSDLANVIAETAGNDISVLPGLLNYTITCLVKRCYASFKTKMSYADHNAVVGMLDCDPFIGVARYGRAYNHDAWKRRVGYFVFNFIHVV